MRSENVRRWIVGACLFLAFGAVAVYVEVGDSPSLANMLSLIAVLSFLSGLTLSPRVLFGPVTLKGGDSALLPSAQSGKGRFSQFPKSLAFGFVAFVVFAGASVIARHL